MKTSRLKGKTLSVSGFLDDFEKDDVMRGVDILALFESFGVSLVKKGKSHMGACPWHDDGTPSLSVDPEKKLYHCFGCGESGDAITLVEKMKGLSFKDALKYLKKEAPVRQRNMSGMREETVQPEPSEIESPAPRDILDTVAAHYERIFRKSLPASSYLSSRGLSDESLLGRFGVGYCDGSLVELIGEDQKRQLVGMGILVEKDGAVREHFVGCVVFPLRDEDGGVASFYGRAIASDSTFKHRYPKGSHRGIFNRKASAVYEEIILAEGVVDALSLIALGFENVQPIYGVNGLTEEHLAQLKSDRVKSVVLALDADDPGVVASMKLASLLSVEGFAVKTMPIAALSSGEIPKDWNQYLVGGGKKEWLRVNLPGPTAGTSMATEPAVRFETDGVYQTALTDTACYRISGAKDVFVGSLRVAIRAHVPGGETGKYFVDTLDLYSSRARAAFAQNFARACDVEIGLVERDLTGILDAFEQMRDGRFSKRNETVDDERLSEDEIELGLELLRDPLMFDRIVADMELLGYVGEDVNKKLLYIAASSRVLDDPISVIILSQSAAGKSFLVDTVRKLIPPRDVIAVTSLSDQALNYVDDLLHKFLILGEAVHSDSVEHQIREMLSGKELSRMVVVKDDKTGAMKSAVVKRPVIVSTVMSGTNYGINPENASRCFVVSADESREQTRRIHAAQRAKYSLERYLQKERDLPHIVRSHHAAQRLLRKIRVVNTFARHLGFPDALMRTRRDHDRFLDLIAAVCFLRQYQKEERCENGINFICCDAVDYRVAWEIMTEGVLATTMRDVPRGTLEFYGMIRDYIRQKAKRLELPFEETGFTQREIREHSGYGLTWVKEQIRILLEFEYAVIVKGGGARQKGVYRLLADKNIDELNLSMIPDPDAMARILEDEKSGLSGRSLDGVQI